jgi:hypothetical protein
MRMKFIYHRPLFYDRLIRQTADICYRTALYEVAFSPTNCDRREACEYSDS